MDPKGEEVEGWIIANNLVLINNPDDQPTFYSRVWHTTSSPELALAIGDIQKITSNRRPVILTLQNVIREVKLQPNWNYIKTDWDLYIKQTDNSTAGKQVSGLSVEKAAKESHQCNTHEHPKRQTKRLQTLLEQGARWFTQAVVRSQRTDGEKPSIDNIADHNKQKDTFEPKKANQIKESRREKTSSQILEKDTTKLWQLTNLQNEQPPTGENRSPIVDVGSGRWHVYYSL